MGCAQPSVGRKFPDLWLIVGPFSFFVISLGKPDASSGNVGASHWSVGPGIVAPAQQPDPKSGYGRYCAACHGPAGAGDGLAARPMKQPPLSLANSGFRPPPPINISPQP